MAMWPKSIQVSISQLSLLVQFIVIIDNWELYTFGNNRSGQLGIGST